MMENKIKFYNLEEDGHVFKYNICSDGRHVFATDSSYEAVYWAQQIDGHEREVYVTLPDGIHGKCMYTCYGRLEDDSLEELFF